MRKILVVLAFVIVCPVMAHAQLTAEMQQKIDQVAKETLAKTGVPSASLAVVKDGKIAYVQAYGEAGLNPNAVAKPTMRYSVGSISKQFTAAAILLLEEQGKLSLDDAVGKYVPGLTSGDKVTIRELLSHTSGYQDYWPQDYVMPTMLRQVTTQGILDEWARKPLDFEPGTKWQYSNTNYVIAGLIVEKAGGKHLVDFLRAKVFEPLGMKSVLNIDAEPMTFEDSRGYLRYALGPLRQAPKEGRGWLFAAGELAMTAEDLAKWDISMIDQTVLKPASYREFETEVLLKNGAGTGYGLGLGVGMRMGHRTLSHGGEVSGYTATNVVFPDERAAVVVLTNEDASSAADLIARGIAPLLLTSSDPAAAGKLAQAQKIFEGLQKGTLDRALFTDNANYYFTEQALKDFGDSLGPLGAPEEFVQVSQGLRGGMTLRVFRVKCGKKTLRAWTYEMPDGKLEQYQVATGE
jgi:D-alanyl-D-alanine carboxypeptidase